MGKKTINFVMRRDISQGRKSEAGGAIKSKAAQLYTPLDVIERKQMQTQPRNKAIRKNPPAW